VPLTGEYQRGTADWANEQLELFERTNGAEGNTLKGRPIIVLTSVGAKSGKLRKTPLMRVEHDGAYAVVASRGGAPTHPTWYHNLVAEPHVELQDGAVKRDYVAHIAEGRERTEWWDRAVEAWPDYEAYTKRTDREIPVFVLVPVPLSGE
jgi:deazaflavin-dependent oxidoreductase (nitroreductase family)